MRSIVDAKLSWKHPGYRIISFSPRRRSAATWGLNPELGGIYYISVLSVGTTDGARISRDNMIFRDFLFWAERAPLI